MKYELVIFDVDGTLLDTSEGVLSSVKYTIERFGFDMPDDKQLRTFIGPPIQRSFADTFGLSGDIIQEMTAVFRDRYKGDDLIKALPYEGIYECFDSLESNGIKTAIATYKRDDYAQRIMKHFHFDDHTKIIHGADDKNKLSKSDIIEICINESGIPKEKVLMVGDTDNDATGAEDIGVDFLAVTFGFGFKPGEEITYPHVHVSDTAADIASFVLKGVS